MVTTIIAPILSLITFSLGIGLLTTLLTVKIHALGGGAHIIGLLTAVYYFGMVLGSFHVGTIIKRVGHIRVYAAFAAILSISALLFAMVPNYWWWMLFRFIGGYCVAGLYVAIQSWLLVIAPTEKRGQMISLYMLAFYAAVASGQFILNLSDPKTIMPFCLITITCSLSIVPISMTRATCPNSGKIAPLSLFKLYKISPSGLIGSFCSGMMTSAIYGLMPLFVMQLNIPSSYVAYAMSLIIFGALLIQYPIGHLSDRLERRKILFLASFITFIISLIIIVVAHLSDMLFLFLCFIFGGISFTIYPLSINHACDYLQGKEITAATQGLLLVNGIGSIIGPLAAPPFLYAFGHFGLFIYFAIIAGFLALFFSWRRKQRPGPPKEQQGQFIGTPPLPTAPNTDHTP